MPPARIGPSARAPVPASAAPSSVWAVHSAPSHHRQLA